MYRPIYVVNKSSYVCVYVCVSYHICMYMHVILLLLFATFVLKCQDADVEHYSPDNMLALQMKSPGLTKLFIIHPLGTKNACVKFYGNQTNSC